MHNNKANPSHRDSQRFGVAITTSLVIGTMIGSGIFLLPASLAEFGAISLAGWLMAALGAVCLAWVFAKLSHWHPGLGGPYHYTRIGIGEFPAFLVAWGYWISVWTGNAAIAMAAVSYCKLLIPALNDAAMLSTLLALSFVWLFTFINILGVKEAGVTQLVTTLLKVVPLIIFAIAGFWYVDWSHLTKEVTETATTSNMIIAAAALWLWAFLGIESASIPADNIKEPQQTIPRATMLGVAIVAVIYVLGTIVVMGVLPAMDLAQSNGPFADAARSLWGSWAGLAMTFVALVSTLGALNGLILLGGQMPMAAAKDQLFPHWFAQQNNRGAPTLGIIISSVLTSLLLLTTASKNLLGVFNFAILLSTTSILVPYIFCSAAAFRFQSRQSDNLKALSLAIIIIAFLFSLWALAGAGQEAVYWGFILMMLGVPVYTWLKMNTDRKNDSNLSIETRKE
ncbi:amino acid permease [Pleionea litopenaei]|uniref:Arginine/agmatine antiporter n=1 Tax=Pleionea litopenaei TaxID=3070815 RepID=A0AA51X614_9GAMM|nr:amino acid permease [Pleionea sp. HL-JVS1]WMS86797.1 amino acid permease [Pleionea sp. HL-JVS1]